MIPVIRDNSHRHARICYKSDLVSSTEAPNALTVDTYRRYKPSTGAVVAKFQTITTTTKIDCIGLAAHNIGTQDGGTQILIQYATTVGGALTDIESITPEDNGAILVTFDELTVAEIAITTNAVTAGLELGVVFAGIALVMDQPIYGGISPPELSQMTDYHSSMSETGQFLGRTIIRKGAKVPFTWQHLRDEWYRETFQPFVLSAISLPFFIKWRPDRYENTAYGYTTDNIKPQNMGGGVNLFTVSFDMAVHSDV